MQHHRDFAAGIRLVGGNDVPKSMTAIVSVDPIAGGRGDSRPLNFEMARRITPLSIDRVGARRGCGYDQNDEAETGNRFAFHATNSQWHWHTGYFGNRSVAI